ncbi:MAG TPA: aldose 1-epimerase [Terriglobales bacterium]|nr:aldose 1-epimerase [Terriglobales bacterium]
MNVAFQMTRIAAVLAIFVTTTLAQNNVLPTPKVGGLDVIRLERKATSGGKMLEFLSATLLPGRGMNMFQITANIPGKGVTELLQSPSLEEAAQQMTGTDKDTWGNASTSFGGAFLVPWISRISGEMDADGQYLTAIWRDKKVKLPLNFQSKYSVHGLIRAAKVEELHTKKSAHGQIETGVIHAGNFNGHWFSETDIHFTIALMRDAVEATIVATNVGKEAEPMGAGWHPYFAIPSGDRSQARLHIPGHLRSVVDTDGLTTGELQPVQNTPFDFTAPNGALLPENLLANFSRLDRERGSADAWLSDPKSNYGIRVRAMSPGIKTFTIYAPKDRTAVAIEPQLNFPDPFGKEWKNMDTGMVVLEPGQSATWKVRLELFSTQAGNR